MNTTVAVQTAPFDGTALTAALAAKAAGAGATVTFTGWVRGEEGLVAMTLEHYPGMTEKELTAIARQAAQHWSLGGVVIVHRVGRLEVGAPIVYVGTASAHRQAAFAACEFIMDWLKTKAPFWKREEWADGRLRWVEAKASDDAAAARWRPSCCHRP